MSHLHIEASNSYSRLELSNWVAMVPSLIDGMASPTRYHTSTTIVHIPSSFSTVLTDHAVTRWQLSLQLGAYDPSNNNWALWSHRSYCTRATHNSSNQWVSDAPQFGRRLAPDLWQFGQRAMCDSSYGFFTPILKAGEKWHNGLLNLWHWDYAFGGEVRWSEYGGSIYLW